MYHHTLRWNVTNRQRRRGAPRKRRHKLQGIRKRGGELAMSEPEQTRVKTRWQTGWQGSRLGNTWEFKSRVQYGPMSPISNILLVILFARTHYWLLFFPVVVIFVSSCLLVSFRSFLSRFALLVDPFLVYLLLSVSAFFGIGFRWVLLTVNSSSCRCWTLPVRYNKKRVSIINSRALLGEARIYIFKRRR